MQKYSRWYFLLIIFLLFIGIKVVFSHGHEHAEEEIKGPHGGQLVEHGRISLETIIVEKGVPPRMHVYVYYKNKQIAPEKISLQMQLKRFGGEVEAIHFNPSKDFLESREVISEPHSFDVNVKLSYKKKDYAWQYPSYEGRLSLPQNIISEAGIKTRTSGAATLFEKLTVYGKILANRDAMAPIYPRYSGIIKSMNKNLGDSVQKGEVIANIESNESLQNYSIASPITGTITKKNVTVGEMVKEDKPIYEIADLNTVWADLTLYRKDANQVRKGMKVIVSGDEGKPRTQSIINYISPLGIEDSQTVLARVILTNDHQQWLPGMYVNSTIILAEKIVRVAVPDSALQRLGDKEVVFVRKGNTFEATPVVLGERGDRWVEILSGLKPGQSYVTENSFFLKADLGKSSAEHDD